MTPSWQSASTRTAEAVTTKPRCAVVIPTFNGSHLLSTCLEALLSYPPERCEMNVIVVDDASSDGTVERFGACDEDVTMVARERNGGFAHACNDGAAAAGDAEYLVFLNNDTIPIPGWLDALVDEAREHGATAVGSKLLYPNGTVQHAGITIGQDRWPHNLYVGLPGEHDAVNRAKSLPAVTAACLLIRRDAFEQAGGFDTAFLNGYEDVDLCLRLGEEGHEVRYCPRSVLYHLESVTRWADYSVRHTSDNDRLYAERWLDRVKPDDIEHYLADGLISVQYGPSYPVRMAISPLLATVDRETEPEDRLEQLLSIRTEDAGRRRDSDTSRDGSARRLSTRRRAVGHPRACRPSASCARGRSSGPWWSSSRSRPSPRAAHGSTVRTELLDDPVVVAAHLERKRNLTRRSRAGTRRARRR